MFLSRSFCPPFSTVLSMNPQIATTTPSPAAIDGIFRALSDTTRRNVIQRLSVKPASVSDLAAPYHMALPSFVEHLKVLEGCGLVRSKKTGRVRTYELVPDRLKVAEDWLRQATQALGATPRPTRRLFTRNEKGRRKSDFTSATTQSEARSRA